MSVEKNLAVLNEQIEAACRRVGRDPDSVEVIAVTKYASLERTKEAIQAGINNIGENRDDSFLNKKQYLTADKPVWHFIGTLQSRKVRNVINEIDYLHSLDRMSLVKEIEKRADERVKCLVQVNVSGEQSKFGLQPDEVEQFISKIKDYPKVEVIGLMTMAPYTDDETIIRNCFQQLKQIQTNIKNMNLPYAPCQHLSMGMSNDFQIAIEEGATMIRIGSALIGDEK